MAFENGALMNTSSSLSSSNHYDFERQTVEYKLDINTLTNYATSSSMVNDITNSIKMMLANPINSLYDSLFTSKDWKSAKTRQLKLDKYSLVVCTRILDDVAKMLAYYMSTKSSKDRTIFRKPSGYKTNRT